MENLLKSALYEALTFLETHHLHYAIIGGIANQVWGHARFTYDLDIKVLVPDSNYTQARHRIESIFSEPGRPNLPQNPFIVSVKIGGVIADFLLAAPGYEECIITRAIPYTIDDRTMYICTAEDLIIQKVIANRAKDWQDIKGILIEQAGNLDHAYIEEWLLQFVEALEQPELLNTYRQIHEQILTAM